MRLKKIKLVGFKSFVDPTIIQLQSSLTGVVGPNGCGKSNIIDAVRWVMGEISAKQLRGESMTDVIFNGSSSRKPVGQAAVELIFDNSDASLGGEYAQYSEIAIRREVDRDALSDYFLNNTRCRRKDITDVFLGTGLGPRSYAIIEQGMISQLIEAKPDELRVLIEEAAGISKYKERRRETETRIRHTKENLSRLNDIREELEKQLRHLKNQANAANRYKKLKQDERLTKAQLLTLHWQAIANQLTTLEATIKNREIDLENQTTALHALEAKVADGREQQHTCTTNFNNIQEQYYRVGANIARLEQQIQHTKDRKAQLTKDLEQINQVWHETLNHQQTDEQQAELLVSEKGQLETDVVSAQTVAQQSQQRLLAAEESMRELQDQWDEFTTQASRILQQLEVEHTRILHLEQRATQEDQILANLNNELNGLDFNTLTNELNVATEKFSTTQAQYETLHTDLAAKQEQIAHLREQNKQLAGELDVTRSKLQELLGRKASLDALQQEALGKNEAAIVTWLQQHNLQDNPRVAQRLQVESGWETAVETVLGSYLEAVCVNDFTTTIETLRDLAQGNLILLATDSKDAAVSSATTMPTLLNKVTTTLPLHNLLKDIYVATDLAQALQLRANLTATESIITKDGIWLGSEWVRIAFDKNPRSGVLQRERELQELMTTITQQKALSAEQETILVQQQTTLSQLESELQVLQQTLRTTTTAYSEIQGQVSAKETHLQHLRERQESLVQEIKTHQEWLQQTQTELVTARTAWQEASNHKDRDEAARNALAQEKTTLQQQVTTLRERATQDQQAVTNIEVRLKLVLSQHEYLLQSLERATQRLSSLKEHQANVERSLQEADAPLAAIEQELQQELQQRLTVESALNQAKEQVANIENAIREIEKERTNLAEIIEQIRLDLEKLRTERQGLQVRATTYTEQITELEFQLDTLIAELPAEATLDAWEQQLQHIAARIERLGPINLAAIEEFEKLTERKNYLDAQNQDLVTALNTLENAIRKIDHDTRARFKETYENINATFQALFPKIFNGGKAYLELTSNDLLDTGVLIMAQPPGKRNASIHLLSGGEKALTAIALIFSIFQLTPAPFCMLDEVDAPLDDLNVTRFCNLVKEMAKTVQFIFVTHNKLTMEIANQLMGITMQEPGVSRIVSVDVATAAAMAS